MGEGRSGEEEAAGRGFECRTMNGALSPELVSLQEPPKALSSTYRITSLPPSNGRAEQCEGCRVEEDGMRK